MPSNGLYEAGKWLTVGLRAALGLAMLGFDTGSVMGPQVACVSSAYRAKVGDKFGPLSLPVIASGLY